MKPFLLLLVAFTFSLLGIRIFKNTYAFALSGRIAIATMLVFTAIGHFVFTKGMAMMLPDFIPNKKTVVQLTGIIEIAAAIGLFIPKIRLLTAYLLILFFVLILPANIYAAVHHIDYQKESFDGNGPAYLWFRIPFQILLIVWVYLSVIKF